MQAVRTWFSLVQRQALFLCCFQTRHISAKRWCEDTFECTFGSPAAQNNFGARLCTQQCKRLANSRACACLSRLRSKRRRSSTRNPDRPVLQEALQTLSCTLRQPGADLAIAEPTDNCQQEDSCAEVHHFLQRRRDQSATNLTQQAENVTENQLY